MSSEATENPAAQRSSEDPSNNIVQYIVLRKDLWEQQGWPVGPVAAQACHASVAAIWKFADDEITQAYCSPENLDAMHKVVLEVKGEAKLRNLSEKLTAADIKHYVWIEQPEGIPTCIATKPYHKHQIHEHVKKYQLCKAPIS